MTTAAEAMARADAAHEKIESHEDLCAERYAHIHTVIGGVRETVDKVLKILAWGGTTAFGILLVVLGFLATRSLNNNDEQISQLRNQIEEMQRVKPQPAVLDLANPSSRVSQIKVTTS